MKKSLFFISIVLVLLSVSLFAIYSLLNSPVSSNSQPQNFVINQGDGLTQIAKRLETNGLIRNQHFFVAQAYRLGLNSKLQAGEFQLSPSMSQVQIISRLSRGGSFDFWFTVIDGQRIEEFALDQDFLTLAKAYEGQFFPDKYLIPKSYSNQQIIDLIVGNFQKKYPQLSSENLIMASIVEREGKSLESKKMIAGILQNRLQIGMALQVDATVQYARDSLSPPQKYWLPLASSDITRISSPFNTYQNTGLPPSPICNPGQDSLTAVTQPTDSDYLFYITGKDGKMYYATTLEQHNTNIRQYLR